MAEHQTWQHEHSRTPIIDMTTFLRINVPSVTHQTIDGEVIILNLDNGYYYSLTGTGALIWQICDGATADEIVGKAVDYFGGDSETVSQSTRDFVKELESEELLVAAASKANSTNANQLEGPRDFVAPKLEKFTEMSDLLLIDPIHDVDAAGWPHVPAETVTPPVSQR